MKKVDRVIIKETAFIALVSLILSVLMQAVFLIIGRWSYTVLLGNILGLIAAVGNFFAMGITLQFSLGVNVKNAKNKAKLSMTLRTLLLFIIAVIGYSLPIFNLIAVVIPFVFPRIAVALRAFTIKNKRGNAY